MVSNEQVAPHVLLHWSLRHINDDVLFVFIETSFEAVQDPRKLMSPRYRRVDTNMTSENSEQNFRRHDTSLYIGKLVASAE